jgi:DNA-binding response OmpR family regulator
MAVPVRYRFSHFVFDEDEWRLLLDGTPVRVQDKPLELLALLLRPPGHLHSRGDLIETLWPDASVTEQSLRQAVRKLRSALRDDRSSLVQTVRGRGIRFAGAVEVEGAPTRPTGPRELGVLLVDDHVLFRRGIRTLLEAEPDIGTVHEASNAADAVSLFRTHRPDIVLLDVELPGSAGVDIAARILDLDPEAAVLFLSGHQEQRTLERALATGARGYLSKAMEPEELIREIRAVVSG